MTHNFIRLVKVLIKTLEYAVKTPKYKTIIISNNFNILKCNCIEIAKMSLKELGVFRCFFNSKGIIKIIMIKNEEHIEHSNTHIYMSWSLYCVFFLLL